MPEGVAANIRGRSNKIVANVEITDPNASGVIFAHGSRFGGHALFIKNKKLNYVYNFLGIKPEQRFVSSDQLKPGVRRSSGVRHLSDEGGVRTQNLGSGGPRDAGCRFPPPFSYCASP